MQTPAGVDMGLYFPHVLPRDTLHRHGVRTPQRLRCCQDTHRSTDRIEADAQSQHHVTHPSCRCIAKVSLTWHQLVAIDKLSLFAASGRNK